MSDLPDIKFLMKMDDTELSTYALKRDKDGKIRNLKGHYIPGQTGRVKKGKLLKKPPAKQISELIPAEIRKKFGDDPLLCMKEMLKLAATKQEAARISKELLPYTHPKLASVEQKTFNYHSANIQVEWQDDDGKFQPCEVIDARSEDFKELLSDDSESAEAGDDGATA